MDKEHSRAGHSHTEQHHNKWWVCRLQGSNITSLSYRDSLQGPRTDRICNRVGRSPVSSLREPRLQCNQTIYWKETAIKRQIFTATVTKWIFCFSVSTPSLTSFKQDAMRTIHRREVQSASHRNLKKCHENYYYYHYAFFAHFPTLDLVYFFLKCSLCTYKQSQRRKTRLVFLSFVYCASETCSFTETK